MVDRRPRYPAAARWSFRAPWRSAPVVSVAWFLLVAAATSVWAVGAFDEHGEPARTTMPVLWSSPAALVVLAVWWRGARGVVPSALAVAGGALAYSWISTDDPFTGAQWVGLAWATVVGPLAAAALLRRAHADLRRPGPFDAVRFVVVVIVGACASALAIVGLLAAWQRTPTDVLGALRSLAINDLSAIVVIVPAAFVLRSARVRRRARPPRLGRRSVPHGRITLYAAGAAAITAVVVAVSMGGTSVDLVIGAALMLALVGFAEGRRRNELAARRAIGDLALDRARLHSFVDGSPEGVLVLDALGRVESANRGAAHVFGTDHGRLVGRSLLELVPAPVGVDPAAHLVNVLGPPDRRRRRAADHLVWEAQGFDGGRFPVQLAVSRVEVGGRWGYVAKVRDGRLLPGATVVRPIDPDVVDWTDQLRADHELEAAVREMAGEPGELALYSVAVDADALARSVGVGATAVVLDAAQHRIALGARSVDTVVRTGRCEYALLCRVDDEPGAVGSVAARILTDFASPFVDAGAQVAVVVHVGVAVETRPGTTAAELLRKARAAQARAAREDTNGWAVFNPTIDTDGAAIDLREVDADARVVLRYQPMLDLSSGHVAAVEALARLQRDDGSLIGPNEFVPLWERAGLATRLGELVLPRALEDLVSLRTELGYERLRVAVNVSPYQLDRALVDLVRTSLARFELPASALSLEITETAPIDTMDTALDVLRSLHELGIGIALDDFGSGFTRLDLIRDLPIDTLKIDGSFVRRMVDVAVDRDIVETIVALARRRDLTVVAEGVEGVEQVEALTRLGCNQAQGFLFGRPVDVEQLRYLLREWLIVPAIATRDSLG